jgi:DNA-binding response OmpR family regulator
MAALSGLSVLLVEDEFLIALDAEQLLKALGAARVDIVATFDEAERRARNGEFDLAILDINLNGRLSFPIGQIIMDLGIPVVFASGYDLREGPPTGLESVLCVTKPYSAAKLKDAVAAALKR